MTRRIRQLLPFLALTPAAVLAGCGPVVPLAVQTQNVGLSLILGKAKAVATAPLAPLPLGAKGARLPGFVTTEGTASPTPASPPAPVITRTETSASPAPATTTQTSAGPTQTTAAPTTTTTTTTTCAPLNPLSPISLVDTTIPGPPAPATYTYRSTIAQTTSGTAVNYTGPTTWQIGSVSSPDSTGNYTYKITKTVPVAGFSDTTTYEVVPTGLTIAGETPGGVVTTLGSSLGGLGVPANAPSVQTPDEAGLYLDKEIEPDGTTFAPVEPAPLVNFPITIGASFKTTATDGKTTISYTSTVGQQTKINACGTAVGVDPVNLTAGMIVAAGSTTPLATFTETLDVDPNAGGIVVADTYTSSATKLPSGTITLNEADTSNVVPKAAQ